MSSFLHRQDPQRKPKFSQCVKSESPKLTCSNQNCVISPTWRSREPPSRVCDGRVLNIIGGVIVPATIWNRNSEMGGTHCWRLGWVFHKSRSYDSSSQTLSTMWFKRPYSSHTATLSYKWTLDRCLKVSITKAVPNIPEKFQSSLT